MTNLASFCLVVPLVELLVFLVLIWFFDSIFSSEYKGLQVGKFRANSAAGW
jgi:hypothetical protein